MVRKLGQRSLTKLIVMKVYDLPRDLLTTLQLRDRSSTEPDHEDDIISTRSNSISTTTGDTIIHGTKACSLCGVSFNTVEEQRSHIRSDFHGYNLKQKLRNLPPVSENDFERLVGGTAIVFWSNRGLLTCSRSQRKLIGLGLGIRRRGGR
jgi:hypothetical protein